MNDMSCFITGATGCIGAWIIRTLVRNKIPVSALDFNDSRHRLELIMDQEEISKVNFLKGDIGNLDQVSNCLKDSGANSVIHLAALQFPFCQKNPPLGARVNVEGTVNIFESAKLCGINKVVYASSTAVYGFATDYSSKIIKHHTRLKPKSLYGVYKQANEHTAKIYWMNDGISSIGLRPHVVYGPGRDQGITSSPTQAMAAAAKDLPFTISFGGRFCFQYVEDVANVFIRCLSVPSHGAEVFNIGGDTPSVNEIIVAIEQSNPSVRGKIRYEEKTLPFPGMYDNTELTGLLGKIHFRPLEVGVKDTLSIFKRNNQ